MHRTNPMLRIVFGLILGGLLLASRTTAAPTPAGSPAGQLPAAQLPAAQPIQLAQAEKEAPPPRVKATPFNLPLGSTKTLEMRTKKDIKSAVNENDAIAEVRLADPNNTKILRVTGRSVGRTIVSLTATDGTTEDIEITVEIDVEFIKSLLLRVAPQANISVTAVAGQAGALSAIIIEGNAGPGENINLIMRTAEAIVGPNRVFNAMRMEGVMQVQLDVVIAQVSRSQTRRMAFDFWNSGLHHDFASEVAGGISMPTSLSGTLLGLPSVANQVVPQNNLNPTFYVGLYQENQWLFNFLQILRNENMAKLLAEPRLVTMSGRGASFLSGGEQAVPSPGGLGAVSVTFVPFGTRLTFLPWVLANGKIYLEVEPEVSSLDQSIGSNISGTQVAGRRTQRVHTSIEMEEGQTFVIGGLIQKTVQGSKVSVPVLGDLPFIGAAFSGKQYAEDETELLVMVTPHLVDPMSCNQLPKLLPGQETRSPDDFELFLEGILEAPRGQREVCEGGRYVAPYKHSPSVNEYPCGGNNGCGNNGCGKGCNGNGCGKGCNGNGTQAPGTPAMADKPEIGYPKVSSAGDSLPGSEGKSKSSAEESGAELLPPTDVPSDGR
jgi:pilus assembly protein CpaC